MSSCIQATMQQNTIGMLWEQVVTRKCAQENKCLFYDWQFHNIVENLKMIAAATYMFCMFPTQIVNIVHKKCIIYIFVKS